MKNIPKVLSINKENYTAEIEYNLKIYEAKIKYSISHGFYAEFYVCSKSHRVNIDKEILK